MPIDKVLSTSIANGAVTGSALATDISFGFRNRIINGDFNIWQRGTSFSSSSVNEYSADRFRTEGYGHNSVISRQTFTVGQTDVPGYPTYFCRVASSTTVSAGQYWAFQQRVEAPQVMSGSGTYTLSFWAKSTTSIAAGSFSYGIDGPSQSSPALTTTWQKITQTVVVGNNESTGYVSIYLVYFAPTKGNITVDIANVQVEYGSQATPFERRPVGTELALCYRYYYQLGGETPYQNINTVIWYNAAECVGQFSYPVTMRAIPTVSKSGNWTTLGSGSAGVNLSGDQVTTKNMQLGAYSGSGGTAGYGATLRGNNDLTLRVTFSAEL